MGGGLPPAHLEFESKSYGYQYRLYPLQYLPRRSDSRYGRGCRLVEDASGIIIDLRGNPGGDPNAVEQLAAQFLEGQFSFGSFRIRDGSIPRLVDGKNTYAGSVVVLIDNLSFSGSEYFSSGMQALDRAVINGDRSPGGLSAMTVITLPNGAIFGYPVAQLITSDGKVLEGYGVIPDITVTLERNQLLDGFDAQLQAAVSYIEEILLETSSLSTPISITSSLGLPPVMDGTISPGEWDGAQREQFSDGSDLLLMRHGGYLYLGIRATTLGMLAGNVFVQQNHQIAILHASAALGTAIYQEGSDTWQQSQDFSWRCRKTGHSEVAQAERAAFLQTESWVASNSRMGMPNELEYQLKIDGSTLHLAVIFLKADDPSVKIPWPAELKDDCISSTEGELPSNMEPRLSSGGCSNFLMREAEYYRKLDKKYTFLVATLFLPLSMLLVACLGNSDHP